MKRGLNKQTKMEIKTRKRERILNIKTRKEIEIGKPERKLKSDNQKGN